MKESTALIAGAKRKEDGQLMLKRPKLPDDFQGRLFKGSVREGTVSVRDQRT